MGGHHVNTDRCLHSLIGWVRYEYEKKIRTFPGTNCPLMIAPSCGTMRGIEPGTTGYILNPSSSTALKYFCAARPCSVMSSCDANVERMSLVNLSRICRFSGFSRYQVNPVRLEAVFTTQRHFASRDDRLTVSLPATNSTLALSRISCLVIPFSLS